MARADREATIWASMLATGLYKRNQGRMVRNVTVGVMLAVVALACWTLSVRMLSEMGDPIRIGVPAALGAIGAWVAFRIVNYPQFADFLIDVEVELTKVSWPSKDELWRATLVVLLVMFLLSATLLAYDLVWQQLLRMIGILRF